MKFPSGIDQASVIPILSSIKLSDIIVPHLASEKRLKFKYISNFRVLNSKTFQTLFSKNVLCQRINNISCYE